MSRLRFIISMVVLLALSGAAQAQTRYRITVNTSALSGTTGSLDFQFAPDVPAQAAEVQIFHFATDGTLDTTSQTSGGGYGTLPGNLTINNGLVYGGPIYYNDVFQNITYGSTLSFIASFSGPALTAPTGTDGGSTFAFTLYDASGATVIGGNPDGSAADITLNGDGSFTVSSSPTSLVTVSGPPAPVPEASSLISLGLLLGLGVCGLILTASRRKANSAS